MNSRSGCTLSGSNVGIKRGSYMSARGSNVGVNRGSYMSARVLLSLLNELGNSHKMRGLLSILSLFRNEFNEFNNTRVRKFDSINHRTIQFLKKTHFLALKRQDFATFYATL